MRTKERFVKRIVIPVLAVILVAYLINFFIRGQVADSPPTPEGVDRSTLVRSAGQDPRGTPEFSPETVETEVTALQTAVAQLETTEGEASGSASNGIHSQELRERAQQRIEALRDANEDNWEDLHQNAVDAVQQYANAAGDRSQAGSTSAR